MTRHALHRAAAAMIGLVATASIGACGFDPAALTLPGGSGSSGYVVHIEFASVLNLPTGAPVVANGAKIGRLTKVSIINPVAGRAGAARADISVDRSVRLPRATTAQLRQNTILGDIYIALDTRVTGNGGVLQSGGTIPVTQTKPAMQVEDVLSGMANFVAGGAIPAIQKVMVNVNDALPRKPEDTAAISARLRGNLIDLSQNQYVLDDFLAGLDKNVAVVQNNRSALDVLLTPDGAKEVTEIANSLVNIISVLGAVGGIAHSLVWLGPTIQSADAAARAFVPMVLNPARPLNLSAPSNLNRLIDFLKNQLIPWVERPQVDFSGVKFEGPKAMTTSDQTARIVSTLRMIGMVR